MTRTHYSDKFLVILTKANGKTSVVKRGTMAVCDEYIEKNTPALAEGEALHSEADDI